MDHFSDGPPSDYDDDPAMNDYGNEEEEDEDEDYPRSCRHPVMGGIQGPPQPSSFSTRPPENDDDTTSGWTGPVLQQASYKDLGSPSHVEDSFYETCLACPTIRQAVFHLLRQPTTTRDYSIQVRSYDILQHHPVLGDLLLRYPGTYIQKYD